MIRYMCSADLDNDKDIDIVLISVNGYVFWLENQGTVNFLQHNIESGYLGGHGIYACDFDKDDDIDIITCASDINEVNWFENNGSGNFSKNNIDNQTLEPGYVHCSDINNNGYIDIIGMSFELKQLYWWQHKGNNSFVRHIIHDSYAGTICKTVDIDNDGDMDIFVSDYINGIIY